MKFATAIATLAPLALAAAANAQIAYWQFPTAVPASTVNFIIPFPIAADTKANAGAAVITTDALTYVSGSSSLTQGSFQYFGGSLINAQPGVIEGSGLSIRGNTGNVTNGKSITLQFDTTGFTDIALSYAERATSTGSSSIAFSYSADGTNFTALSTATMTRDSVFRLRTVDFSSIAALNNIPAAYIRMTFDGFGSAAGATRIDNVTIYSTVPTPAAAALLGLGGLVATRRRRA